MIAAKEKSGEVEVEPENVEVAVERLLVTESTADEKLKCLLIVNLLCRNGQFANRLTTLMEKRLSASECENRWLAGLVAGIELTVEL